MYELSRNLPHELIYKRKPNKPLGIVFFIVGIIGELLSLYIFFFIINSTSFAESSFILNLLMTGNIPLSFFITIAGGLCLTYSLIELFYINGWTVRYSDATNDPIFFTFWQLLFFKSKKVIPKQNIKRFTIEVIYYDQLKLTNRKRLQISYENLKNEENQKFLLYEEINTDSQSELRQIIKDFNTIMKSDFPISIEEIDSKVIET